MSLNDILTIVAILLAPIAAVQVQKWLEVFREQRGRRLNVFKTLMATRAANVSPEHVQALNMIDLEFQGKRYKPITDTWKAYLDHLASYPKDGGETLQQQWGEKRVDRLVSLLMEMGKSLGYEFDEVHVKKGVYAPEAHGQIENENLLIRRGLIRLLYGDSAVKMDVESLPVSEDEASEQKLIRKALLDVLSGKEAISVRSEHAEPKD
ncbi:hypothetical protein HNO52_08650 [Billgrantia diversa]|uniref:DUF6680 family protein n=1 Tax=Halomonas sp. MCCC 1A13316 TaxID=2733487 RepID=UPI0018A42AD3|nr:DUF6680 family protein [Halomonas sp. MCCC 1A13316]QOR38570.1 hypothetical protein HNO52_08650 [Halomonas sp. MCCC 1A13316]